MRFTPHPSGTYVQIDGKSAKHKKVHFHPHSSSAFKNKTSATGRNSMPNSEQE